jgi:hypothetical protein
MKILEVMIDKLYASFFEKFLGIYRLSAGAFFHVVQGMIGIECSEAAADREWGSMGGLICLLSGLCQPGTSMSRYI